MGNPSSDLSCTPITVEYHITQSLLYFSSILSSLLFLLQKSLNFQFRHLLCTLKSHVCEPSNKLSLLGLHSMFPLFFRLCTLAIHSQHFSAQWCNIFSQIMVNRFRLPNLDLLFCQHFHLLFDHSSLSTSSQGILVA